MDIANGSDSGAQEDPAALFLHQHQDELEGLEKEEEGMLQTEDGDIQGESPAEVTDELDGVNGELCQEIDADAYSAISQADQLHQEPESIRKWREEQITHLAELDANSREAELEWREKAKKELEDWYIQQAEQLEEMKSNNSTNIKQHCYNLQQAAEASDVSETQEVVGGSEWEHVLHLCDFNPKTSKVSKDVSRMRSVLISLSQVPLALK
ncbi:clathrin light chain A-like isoform X3 [Scyliorhinus canicula]|uniref:clathrin light chain A-like isoform X3 n=1 Tax=Scyliorhinus canicula TaxID=7830 RepID=UPI0018F61836|nr:clathrin light chain A-like isoform X3 [Scyliorhinus canicula]